MIGWVVRQLGVGTEPRHELPDDAVDRDRLLSNVTLCWLTGTAAASACSLGTRLFVDDVTAFFD